MPAPNPIRLGLVGLGRAGWGMHCPELEGKEDLFRFVAACDPLPDRRERMAARYGCRTYEHIEGLLADREVEMVDVASRSIDHYAHAASALRAGRHVFLEKPMCATYGEARRLVRLAAGAKGRLYVRHNRRNEPAFLHVREIMASGILGDVYEVKLFRGGYARRDDWQTLAEFAGGQMLNWGPHIVDHALRFLDAPLRDIWSDAKRVAAVGDAEDHLKIVLRGTNGRVVDMEISGGAAIRPPAYLIWGTRGSLLCEDEKTIKLKYLDPKQKLVPRRPNRGDPGATFGTPEDLRWIEQETPVAPRRTWNIWDELYKAVRKGGRFPVTLQEAIQVMRVIALAKKGTKCSRK
ncbi:MAG: Gfo/Idh/MocA family oxidoreductase [Planctomycetes bacterium]|nr:Gfo/Idh/MocA family oxidoreductase [Planctomycetota bacterium]